MAQVELLRAENELLKKDAWARQFRDDLRQEFNYSEPKK